MSERPTPETDAVATFRPNDTGYDDWTPAEFARRLERERDGLSEAIVGWENKWKCAVEMAAQAEVERDEAREVASGLAKQAERLRKERDEAREERDRYKRMWEESRMETVEAAK